MSRSLTLVCLAVPSLAMATPGGTIDDYVLKLDECVTALEVCYDDQVLLIDQLTAECDLRVEAAMCPEPTVSPSVGGMAVSADGGASVTVPPGAVVRTFPLYVEHVPQPVVDHERVTEVYDIGADGLRLQERATVCLQASSGATGNMCLGFLDESVRPPKWRCEDACVERKGGDRLCGTTDHFTNFAVLLGGAADHSECGGFEALTRDLGGVVESADGQALVSIPPGALRGPATVTVRHVPRPFVEVERASEVYDFGSPIRTFEEPVTVCLATSNPKAVGGCLGFLDMAASPPAWRCEDPCLVATSDRQVCGKTSHFTNFAILLDGGAGASTCRSR